ncbi:MAG TPA: hypothetical protein VMS94_00525 [Acidobacteriota bacterium]|nr:hypothetical protein [Acidobacteriota bacterium]
MNWKNVARLIRIDTKAGRLIRGGRFRRYRESRIFQYLLYGGSLAIGLAIGLAVGNFYSGLSDLELKKTIYDSAGTLFISLPMLILFYNLVLTMMGQIQRAGVKSTTEPLYWLPITWEEHTLASTVAHLIGLPLASIVLFSSAIAAFSAYLGDLPLAALTIFALLASAFLASVTTEIFRVLLSRLIGAIYKTSGKAAVWVRFIGTLLFLVVFYIIWFSFTTGTGAVILIQAVAGAQSAIWFIPYAWLGMALASFIRDLVAQTVIFLLASILFISALFYLAVKLNSRFGLYEPPAITVSKGVYVSKPSFLGRVGFSSLEAAVMRKDFKAFTRRRELMYIFITPIVFILIPLMQYVGLWGGSTNQPPGASTFLLPWMLLAPGAFMAMTVGMMIIGEEGSSVWLFYASPITARSLVKCKYAFICLLSFMVLLICGVIGILVASPSLELAFALLMESAFLIFALGIVSLRSGITGADFVEVPRPRMVRPLTSFVNMFLCFGLAIVILSPLIPYALEIIGMPIMKLDVYVAVSMSAVIAAIITFAFYRMTLKSAEEFLSKAGL